MAWRSESGLVSRAVRPVANVAGISNSGQLGEFQRLGGHRRGRRLARHGRQLAYAVVEHLVQVLIDLLVGLGDFLAKLAGAAAELLGVEILLDVLGHLAADRLAARPPPRPGSAAAAGGCCGGARPARTGCDAGWHAPAAGRRGAGTRRSRRPRRRGRAAGAGCGRGPPAGGCACRTFATSCAIPASRGDDQNHHDLDQFGVRQRPVGEASGLIPCCSFFCRWRSCRPWRSTTACRCRPGCCGGGSSPSGRACRS